MKIKIGKYVSPEARQALRQATGVNIPGAGFKAEFDGSRLTPQQLIDIIVDHGLLHDVGHDFILLMPAKKQELPWMLRKQAV